MLRNVRRNGATRVAVLAVALAVVVAMTLAPINAAAAEWKGTVSEEGGKRIIMNPATGIMESSSVKLDELWRLGGDSDDEDEFFGVISDVQIDDEGNVYLLDSQLSEVKIYTNEGEFIRSIGREGEGPGEFRRPGAMFFTKAGDVAVVQLMPGKIVILSKEGDPVGDMPLPKPDDGGFQILQGARAGAGNTVLFMARQEFDQAAGKWQRRGFLASVTEEGELLTEYTSKTNVINMAAAVMDDKAWDTFERRWSIDKDGKVYACTSYDDYMVEIWNPDGTLDKVIKREFTDRSRSAEEKDFVNRMFSHFAKMIPDCKVKVAENCKDIEGMFIRDDGSIWVLNANGARDLKEGTLGVFDVYNPEGQFVRNVTLSGDGDPLDDLYLFVKDRVYVVTDFLQAAMSAQGVQGLYDEDDEADPMAVIAYKLDSNVLAAR